MCIFELVAILKRFEIHINKNEESNNIRILCRGFRERYLGYITNYLNYLKFKYFEYFEIVCDIKRMIITKALQIIITGIGNHFELSFCDIYYLKKLNIKYKLPPISYLHRSTNQYQKTYFTFKFCHSVFTAFNIQLSIKLCVGDILMRFCPTLFF